MGLRDVLSLPWKRRQIRNEYKSEADSIDERQADPVALFATGSGQVEIGSSAPTSIPPTPRNQEPYGM